MREEVTRGRKEREKERREKEKEREREKERENREQKFGAKDSKRSYFSSNIISVPFNQQG